MPNVTTPHRAYPLPHPDNLLQKDVHAIAAALSAIDADMEAQQQKIKKMEQQNTEYARRVKINQLLGDQLLKL
jgi:hypothetical protein